MSWVEEVIGEKVQTVLTVDTVHLVQTVHTVNTIYTNVAMYKTCSDTFEKLSRISQL